MFLVLQHIKSDNEKKGHWKWNLWCTPVKVYNENIDQHGFGDKMEMNLTISDYFMPHSMIGENDSDETFAALCQTWKVRYFDGNGIKITLLNPNEDLFKEIIV